MATTHFHDHDHDHEHEHEHGGTDLRSWLKTALLLGLGVYFIYIIASGNLSNYINERFGWLSYLAAVLFLVLGVFSGLQTLRVHQHHHGEHDHDHDHHHDHEHGSLSWSTIAIVALPLVLGTLIPSRPLGAEAVDGGISTSAASTSITTFSRNPLERNVLDWLRVFSATEDYTELNGQPADVIGFVYTEPTFGADQFMVARFTVSCCVADASAIGVPVQWAEALPQGEWVRVQGTMQVGEFRGDTLPILHAASVEIVEQPEHPYLYP
jgi:putative membrane protein